MPERNEIKEFIKENTDISEIIGEHVALKESGQNLLGLCPFHNEKTPSFTVFPQRGIFKCFGCGKGGDVFSFITEFHGMSFPDAMELLGGRLGVDVKSQHLSYKTDQKSEKKTNARKALEAAALYYRELLKTKEGTPGQNFFKNRGFSNDIIDKFILGFAPNSWNSLTQELIRQGYTNEALIDAGLVVLKKETGTIFDRFRNRPIFTIKNQLGHVVGFGARKIFDDDPIKGKYVNSPQSLIYDKSKTLYGLYESKNAIRNSGEVLLVEGYADVLSLHQHGIENVVASSGTSVTTEQLKILSSIAKKIYFVYDSDNAGIKAAERGIELAISQGFEVMVAILPEGEDPDSMVQNHGKEKFTEFISQAKSFIDFKIERLKAQGKLDYPSARAESTRELLKLIINIPDNLLHDSYIKYIAPRIPISNDQINDLYSEVTKLKESGGSKKDNNQLFDNLLTTLLPEEKIILYFFLFTRDSIELFFDELEASVEDFKTDLGKKLFNLVIERSEESPDYISDILGGVDINQKAQQILSDIALKVEQVSPKWENENHALPILETERNIHDAFVRLRMKSIYNKQSELMAELRPDTRIERQLEISKEIAKLNEIRVQLVKSLGTGH